MSEMKGEYEKIVKEAVGLLDDEKNSEWVVRYKGYIEAFTDKKELIQKAFKKLDSAPNLSLYLSKSLVDKANRMSVTFDLRYEGQSVGTLIVKDEDITLRTTQKEVSCYVSDTGETLNIDFELDCDWNKDDGDAEWIRQFFANNPKRKDGKLFTEHKAETQLLKNFSIKSSENKLLRYVQPINLFGGYFQFPTPLSASKVSIVRKNNKDDKNGLNYAKERGGHIDILSRQGRGDNAKLTVIELKDQCSKSEPPQQAVKQAIAYAVFMQRLLRCADADNIKWWKFLGFYRDLTEDEIKDRLEKRPIRIQAVIAMPEGDYCKTEFAGKEIEVAIPKTKDSQKITDFIELHYMYFKHEAGTITEITRTSLGFQH